MACVRLFFGFVKVQFRFSPGAPVSPKVGVLVPLGSIPGCGRGTDPSRPNSRQPRPLRSSSLCKEPIERSPVPAVASYWETCVRLFSRRRSFLIFMIGSDCFLPDPSREKSYAALFPTNSVFPARKGVLTLRGRRPANVPHSFPPL